MPWNEFQMPNTKGVNVSAGIKKSSLLVLFRK